DVVVHEEQHPLFAMHAAATPQRRREPAHAILEIAVGHRLVIVDVRDRRRTAGVALDQVLGEVEALSGRMDQACSHGVPPLRHIIAMHVDYRTDPSRYRHWRLACDGQLATLSMDVAEDAPLEPGYRLKLNSYDLGVDIELADALNRIRFEHPEVKSVVITSGKSRMFCSGANIYMLGHSSHASKVNFCKFTNETRNGIEDSSKYSGLKFIA